AALEMDVAGVLCMQARFPTGGRGRKIVCLGHFAQRGHPALVIDLSRCAEVVAQALEEAGRRKWPNLGATSSHRHGGIRVWTHDENGLDSLLVEREQVALILQQHHTLAGSLQGNLAAFMVVPRDG